MSSSEHGLGAYGFVCVIFFVKATTTAICQARVRARTGEVAAPEDKRFFRTPFKTHSEEMVRLRAIWNNDLENVPFFLALATAYVLLGCWPPGAWIYFVGFAIARTAHSVAYWSAKQPLRFFCYAIGVAICAAMALHIGADVYVRFTNGE